jgi:hypothetical protein
VLRVEVIEDSKPMLRRLLAYPVGQSLNEDPGCCLGMMTLNAKVARAVYLAD